VRIANQHEWNILLVRPDRLSRGVKDDHFLDARRFDLASTPAQLGNVRIADRAVHEPPELQMDETLGVGELDRLAGDGFQSRSPNSIAWLEFHAIRPRPRRLPPASRMLSPVIQHFCITRYK